MIVVECYADSLFIKSLDYEIQENHGTIGGVANTMINYNIKIGIIDKDKNVGAMPSYFKEFNLVKKYQDKIELLKHSKSNKYLIKIKPAIEVFLLDIVESHSIDLKKYKLPTKKKSFINYCKSSELPTKDNFKNFLNTIKQKNPPVVAKLKEFIDYSINN